MRYFFACLFLAASSVLAQPVQVQQNADCIIAFNITASGGTIPSTGGFNNRQTGCNSWQISYANNGFSAIALAVQSAPDNSGSPGTWGTMGGTLTFGINPNTNTTGASSLIQAYGTNFSPWVRVALTSATGSGNVIGVLLGYRAAGTAGTSGGGGAAANVNVSQYGGNNVISAGPNGAFAMGGTAASGAVPTANPVLVAGFDGTNQDNLRTDSSGQMVPSGVSTAFGDGVSNTGVIPQAGNAGTPAASAMRVFPAIFNGSTWDRGFVCNQQALFNLSGSGNTQIIAAGTGVLRICHISFSTTAAEDVKITQGTGTNCATGAADVTGLYKSVQSMALDFTPNEALRSSANQAICLNQSAAQALGGTVIYAPAY